MGLRWVREKDRWELSGELPTVRPTRIYTMPYLSTLSSGTYSHFLSCFNNPVQSTYPKA
jgi:hypothetical protein